MRRTMLCSADGSAIKVCNSRKKWIFLILEKYNLNLQNLPKDNKRLKKKEVFMRTAVQIQLYFYILFFIDKLLYNVNHF